MNFIDETSIAVLAGDGGDGCIAFRREKFIAKGGPSGGDGGHGGSVVLIGESGRNTLYHLRFRQLYAAERGRHGEGSNCTGRSGKDLEIQVPLGTVVRDTGTGEFLGEVIESGERLIVAAGGRGGRGNARFATAVRQAPDFSEEGRRGDERSLRLELKLLADVGVVGLPNAGKSTLISVLSAARPKIADYPFTTLVPQLGVVARGDIEEPFVIADLPGLIAGAAQGAGLGSRFLRHVERCGVIVHLVDLSHGEMGLKQEVEIIEGELRDFDPGILERPRLLVGSKLDSADEDRRKELVDLAASRGLQHFEISSVAQKGLGPLVISLARLLDEEDRE